MQHAGACGLVAATSTELHKPVDSTHAQAPVSAHKGWKGGSGGQNRWQQEWSVDKDWERVGLAAVVSTKSKPLLGHESIQTSASNIASSHPNRLIPGKRKVSPTFRRPPEAKTPPARSSWCYVGATETPYGKLL